MSDPRSTPDPRLLNGHEPAKAAVAVVDLCRTPGGARDRQVLFGETMTVLDTTDGQSYVRLDRDHYHGFIPSAAHTTQTAPATHRVKAGATHVYAQPDIKSPETDSLSFGSLVCARGIVGTFVETDRGFIPATHLEPEEIYHTDPTAIAALFLGTPYLWGGNSRWGIDCSGLVQAALLACAVPCPGDSDQQMTLGAPASDGYQRNDLLFWKGHVALVTDPETLIHANAHSMSVAYEPITDTIARIAAKGEGPVTAHRRLRPFSG